MDVLIGILLGFVVGVACAAIVKAKVKKAELIVLTAEEKATLPSGNQDKLLFLVKAVEDYYSDVRAKAAVKKEAEKL